LGDVLIYDHRKAFQANRTVLRARRGHMRRSTDGHYLVLVLEDGNIYDEQSGTPGRLKGPFPLLRGHFEREEIRLDLSGFGMKRTDEELFKDHYKMLTLGQLQYAEDSLQKRLAARMKDQDHYLRNGLLTTRDSVRPMASGSFTDQHSLVHGPGPAARASFFSTASEMARSTINYIDRMEEERAERREQIAKFQIEWHRKLMLAFACTVFFFIGAPLGAIVRKGGMGVPAVISILFFLFFQILSSSTEQMVKANTLSPWPGMWISTIVLLPIGIFLTWKAATDSPLFDRDAYDRAWNRLRSLFRPHAHPPTVP
jgi:lipopolysaccharide export system permease protein